MYQTQAFRNNDRQEDAGNAAAAVALAPEHISAYGLTIEEGTPLAAQFAAGELELPDDETTAQMFSTTIEKLQTGGYEHYETSNFARPGRRSRHNQGYWQRKPYLGLGAAAHSFLREPGFGVRWSNPELLADYVLAIASTVAQEPVQLTKADAMVGLLPKRFVHTLKLPTGV